MDYKGAIYRLECDCKQMDRQCDCKKDGCDGCYIKLAIEALEKQMPKKIVKNDNGWECPSCKAFFATFGGNFIDTNFCPNCGQAIEWDESR